MNKLSQQDWKMILLKYQHLLSQEEGKDKIDVVLL